MAAIVADEESHSLAESRLVLTSLHVSAPLNVPCELAIYHLVPFQNQWEFQSDYGRNTDLCVCALV